MILPIIAAVVPYKIVYPKLKTLHKRSTTAAVQSIQLDITDNESEHFSLHLKKNSNLVTQGAIVEWHYPNGTKKIITIFNQTFYIFTFD